MSIKGVVVILSFHRDSLTSYRMGLWPTHWGENRSGELSFDGVCDRADVSADRLRWDRNE
jgi:hypothetical protein